MRHTRVTAAILSATAAFLLLIVFLFASITMVMNDEARHSREYKELGIAQTMGMSQEEVLDSLMLVIDYMQGNTDSIEKEVTVYGEKVMMFNGRETAHMSDVRELYLGWRSASYVMAGVAAVLIASATAILPKKVRLKALCGGCLWGYASFAAIAAAIGAWFLIDFYSLWAAFHKLFFTNELWLMHYTDRMIQMMPEPFFYNIIIDIFLLFAVFAAAMLAAAGAYLIFKKRGGSREARA